MDMIVTSRVCRYRRVEYKRGQRIPDVEPNHAVVLRTLGRARDAEAAPPVPVAPIGMVGTTQPPLQLDTAPADPDGSDPAPIPPAEPETAPEAAPSEAPKTAARGRYRRRDLRAED